MLCDNQGAIELVTNTEFHRRTKHIDVRIHFIREKQREQSIKVDNVYTKDQLADILTKALSGPLFNKFRNLMGLDWPNSIQ